MTKIYKNEAMAAVHEMMEGFHHSRAINKQTMREFDEACRSESSGQHQSAASGKLNAADNG